MGTGVQKTIKNWNIFTQTIRGYFAKNQFLEVPTPYLVVSPGLEPHLDPFKTKFTMGKNSKDLYLSTSPEFHLKKALSRGFKKIYEIKTCFRNAELSPHHQPEFWMLEWYRANAKSAVIIKDIQNLLNLLCRKFKKKSVKIKIYKMNQLWKKYLNFDLTPKTTFEELKACAFKSGITLHPTDDFDDVFMRLWLDFIEKPQNQSGEPWIVHYYPPSQAALSKLTKDGWADRFEFYWKGLEIANAFYELTDATEQKARFLKDQKKKLELGKEIVPIDDEFIQALKKGMPEASGIALGLDRLFMALFDIDDINQTRLFPFKSL